MGYPRKHYFSHQQKLDIVREYLMRREPAAQLAKRVGVPVHILYHWASQLRAEVLYAAAENTTPAPPAVQDESSVPLRGEMTLKFEEYMAMRSFLNRFETMVRNIAPPV